jgi:hypothetical protein
MRNAIHDEKKKYLEKTLSTPKNFSIADPVAREKIN